MGSYVLQAISIADVNKMARLAALAPSSTCPLENIGNHLSRILDHLTYIS